MLEIIVNNNGENDDWDDEEIEFSNEQIERQDEIHNAIYECCRIITQKEDLEWDMSYIGSIADYICAELLTSKNLGVDRIYYPYSVIEPNLGSWEHTKTTIKDFLTSKDF